MEIASLMRAGGEVVDEKQSANGEIDGHPFDEFLANSTFDGKRPKTASDIGCLPGEEGEASESGMNAVGNDLFETVFTEDEVALLSNQLMVEDSASELIAASPGTEDSLELGARGWMEIMGKEKVDSADSPTADFDVNAQSSNVEEAVYKENISTYIEDRGEVIVGEPDRETCDPSKEALNTSENLKEAVGNRAELPADKDCETAGNIAVDDLTDNDDPATGEIKNSFEKMNEAGGNINSGEEGSEKLILTAASAKSENASGGLSKKLNAESENEKGILKNVPSETAGQEGDVGQNEGDNGNSMGRSFFISKVSGSGAGSVEKSDIGPFKLSRALGTEEAGEMERVELTRLSMKGQRGEVKMVLNPPSLGRLNVELNISDDRVSAVFHADSHAVKTVLEANVQNLREALSVQDLELEGFDVRTDEGGREGLNGERSTSFDRREGAWEDVPGSAEEIKAPDESGSLSLKVAGVDIFA